jgi:retron-type reverse transcriptase
MEKIKIPDKIINWIYVMLTEREIELELHGFTIKRRIYNGCPQGGILSPLLWNLTLNTLL